MDVKEEKDFPSLLEQTGSTMLPSPWPSLYRFHRWDRPGYWAGRIAWQPATLFFPLWLVSLLIVLVLVACSPVSRAEIASSQPNQVPSTIPTPSVIPSNTPLPVLTSNPPRLASTTPSGCMDRQGSIENRRIDNDLLGYPLQVTVYLPPCYDPQAKAGYPLLVLLHGQSMTQEVWLRVGVPGVADRLIASAEAPPFLILMPYEQYYLEDLPESKFGRAVVEVLLPWADAEYRTCQPRACRAIGGISRGAVWAMQIGFSDWQQFGAIGAHTLPMYPFSAAKLLNLSRQISPAPLPRLYLDSGTLDRYHKSAMDFEQLLTQLHIAHEWHVFEGGHDEAYWGANIENYLRWYVDGW